MGMMNGPMPAAPQNSAGGGYGATAAEAARQNLLKNQQLSRMGAPTPAAPQGSPAGAPTAAAPQGSLGGPKPLPSADPRLLKAFDTFRNGFGDLDSQYGVRSTGPGGPATPYTGSPDPIDRRPIREDGGFGTPSIGRGEEPMGLEARGTATFPGRTFGPPGPQQMPQRQIPQRPISPMLGGGRMIPGRMASMMRPAMRSFGR